MTLSVVAIKAAKKRDKACKLGDRDRLYLLVTHRQDPAGARAGRARAADRAGKILS